MADQKVTDRVNLETSSDSSTFHIVEVDLSYSQSKGNFLKEDRARISNLEENTITGVEVYTELTDLPATGVLLVSYKVANDTVLSSNNGYYHWDGAAYVKDAGLANGDLLAGNTDATSGNTIFNSQLLKSNLVEGKNIFNKAEDTGSGFRVDSTSGELVSAGTVYTTGFMNMSASTLYKSSSNFRFSCYYDEDYNVIAGGIHNGDENSFTTPALTVFMRLTMNDVEDRDTVQIEVGSVVTTFEPYEKKVPLTELPFGVYDYSNLKAVMFGDSITEQFDNWTNGFRDITNLRSIENFAVGGQKITWTGGTIDGATPVNGDVSNVLWNSIKEWEGTTPVTPDVFIIAEGTNDISQSSILGSYDDAFAQDEPSTDQLTMANALRKALQYLILNYPDAQVFYMTPLQSITGLRTFDNLLGVKDINVEICERLNVKVIDCFKLSNIIDQNEGDGIAGRYLADGVHPSEAGALMQGKCVAKEFMKLYYFDE